MIKSTWDGEQTADTQKTVWGVRPNLDGEEVWRGSVDGLVLLFHPRCGGKQSTLDRKESKPNVSIEGVTLECHFGVRDVQKQIASTTRM